ncbi:hypothetical protein LINPERHAP1_LOCUS35001, partial [Linum perenne]
GLETAWRRPGDGLATAWRRPGDGLATAWRRPGDGLATAWRQQDWATTWRRRRGCIKAAVGLEQLGFEGREVFG